MAKSIHVAIIMLVSVTLVILLVPPETYGQTWQPKTGTDKSAGFVPDDIGDLGKFDPGFYDLVQKLIQSQDENLRSGPAYHDVVIVVNKYDQDGTDVSEANKDAVVKILGQAGAQNITAADLLSFVTASVPVSGILEISGHGQVYRMGDGQAQLTPTIDKMRLTIGATLDDLRRPGGTAVNGSGVTVGVMDTGINHPDGINGKVIDRVLCNDHQCSYAPASSVAGSDPENLQTSHGTRVAMIIAGSGLADNNGIAPGVDILDAGVMRHYGVSGTLIDLSYAFEWLLGMDADVSNMSLSLGRCNDISFYTTAQLITAEAVDSGMPVVVSAGNYGTIDYTVPLYKSVSQLACAHNVITVGGIDDRDPDNVEMYVRSSRGPASHNINGTIHPILKPEVVAPAHDILVPKFVANDATAPGSGTSYAAPAVTAVVAMTLQERDMEPAAVKAAILLGADWTGPVPCTSVQYEENNPADNCSHARQPQDLEAANDADSLKIINNVGFGILDAGRTLDYVTGASGDHIVEADLHSEADVDMYQFDVSDTENPVKVILSWTSDTFWNHLLSEGNHLLSEGNHYFADLGFTVDCPGMDTISAQSAYQSNEFAVFVPAEAGTCTVTVTGSGIDTPRRSEQNYALASTLPLSPTGDTFVTTWSTAVPGESITIPVGEYAGRYTVDWGDGSASANVTGNQAHAYDATGTYTVSISGNFTRIDLSGDQNNAEKLQSIEQWGDIPWDFMGSAFKGASNMAYSAIDTPNLSSVTNMTSMFSGASSFDGDLSTWDVSSVTDMTSMFSGASSFDGDLSTWDVSGVTDMTSMFSGASSFNGDISGWNVSNVIGMSSMFDGADSFVQNLGAWYIIIDDTPGRTGDWDVSVGSIAAQNAYLDSHNPLYSIGSGGDSDYFVTDGSTLVLKAGHDLPEGRTYSVSITSTGSFGTGNTRTVEVVINDYPVVDAGADLSVTEGSIVNLSGMASDAYFVDSLKYEWSHDGSVAIQFDDPSSPSTWFQAPYVQSNTTITLTLTVSDGLISSADTVDVTILDTGKEPFVTTWHTTWVNDSITIPVGDAAGTYTVDWGDDTASTHTEDANHVYDSAGTYTVSISGDFTSINLGDDKSSAAKLRSIDQWGDIQWDTMKSSFSGAYYMVHNAIDAPDLSGVTDMSNMFGNTYWFNGDLTGWNTSSVTDMSSMFEDAPFFDGDLSTWDVSKVTNMKQMFSGAFFFNGDLSGWDVSNVIYTQDMFHASSSFDGDLSTWDVSSVADMSSMFSGASSFNSDLSGWDVSNVIDMQDMFHGASSFNSDLSDWDVSKVTFMQDMFHGASSFNSDLSDWDVSEVTEMMSMFHGATSFNGDISDWDVSNVIYMMNMFHTASSFNGDISDWDVSNVIYMQDMFHGATSFDGDLSTWDVPSVADMSSMFSGASSFNSDLSDWDVYEVTDMKQMFSESTSFNGDLSDWDVSNVIYMQDMFYGATSFDGDLSTWDVSSVADMSSMFHGASSFNGDLSDWDVYEVTDMLGMFRDASSFNSDLSDWDVSEVTSMQDMFRDASSFDQNLGNWYVVLDNTTIDYDAASGIVGNISAQNSFLNGQNPVYGISDDDSDSFELNGSNLRLKVIPTKSSYTVTITSTGHFGSDNSRTFDIVFSNFIGNSQSIVDAGSDQTVNEGVTVTLAGTASDADGDAMTYKWTHDSGLPISLANDTALLTTFTAPEVAANTTVTFTLTVSDDTDSNFDTVAVTISDVNRAPAVDAGSDQTVNEGVTVTLAGTASDADGDAMTYKWTHDSGLPISLANDTALLTTFTAPEVAANTTVTFTLTVSDDTDSNFDTVAVTISDVNRAPAVDAGSDQTVNEGVTVTLAGTASDADGDAMTYKWTHDSGLPISLANDTALLTTFTAPEVAANTTVTFTLTVSDDTDSNFDTVAVTISDVNRAPAVDAGSDQTVNEGVTVTLAGTASDADGDAMTYKWTHDSGLPISLANDTALLTTFTAPEVAANTTVTFTLTVSDDTDSNFDTVAVTISDVNRAPAVDAGSDQTVNEGVTVTLAGTASDADGDAMTYKWTHDSGLPISLANDTALLTTFTAPEVAANTTVTFTLTVSDDTDSNFDTVAVTISDVNRAPAVDAGSDQTVNEGVTVTLAGTASDADGDAMTYKWTHDSGLPISLANDTALLTTFTAPEVAANTTVTFTLTVSDDTDSNFDTVAVTISDVNRAPAVDAGPDQTVDEGSLVTLNATVIDADGDDLTYSWTHDSSLTIQVANDTSPFTTFTAPTVNADTTITFTLTADDGTATVTDSTVVTINYDDAPVVDAGSDQPAVRTGDTVTLSGTASDDDSTSLTYLWTHDSDLTISFSNATALSTTFLAPAVDADTAITFTLAVDDGTTTATDSLVVTVADVPAVNSLPVINAGSDQIVKEGTSVTLAGTATDSDGDPMTYLWSQTAGSPTVALTGADTLLPVFTAPAVSSDTELVFELAVSDDSDRSTDTVKITVRDVPDDAPFITTWKTSTAGKSITIPVGDASGTYTVDWGDGNTSVDVTGDQRHTYDDAGSHTVSISGDFTKIYLNGQQPNADKLWSINQWGNIRWESMESAFAGASNMRYKAPDAPDLSRVIDMSGMFGKAVSFNGDLSAWDTSSVTDMSGMFSYAFLFNGDLSAWDTSSVTDMSGMFRSTNSFNGDLSAWDTSSVTDMSGMFSYTYSFNGDLSAWDTSSVTDMSGMFFYALPFNGDLSAWNASSVTDMSGMFTYAYAFNGDLSAWNASSVTDMSEMFKSAASFNSDISNWNVSSATDMGSMFHQANSFKRNLGNWYITLDDISIAFDDAPGVIGRITAQNSYLNGQNPAYGISSGGDSDSFELDGNKLKLKTVPTKSLYTVSVTATGDFGRSNSKMVTVTVTDILTGLPPQVDAGIDQTVREGQTVTLNGTATDNNGDTLTYEWTHDSSLAIQLANSTSSSTTFTAPEVAANTTVTFTLTVSDDTDSNFDTVAVTISDVNRAPAVDAGSDQTVNEGVTVTLAGTASDADGDAMTYKWTHDSGLPISLANDTALLTTFTAPEVAANTTVTFTLTVSDDTDSNFDTVAVTISDVNRAPAVDAGSDQTVNEGVTVTLAGTASDADGDAMTYKWTHDSGLPISLANDTALLTTFTAPEVAANTTVTFTLTVSDDTDSNFDTVAVTISDVNRAPAVDAGSDQTVNEGVTVTLAGTASDADGDAMTYKWTHDSGLPISLANDTALLTTFTAPEVAANTTVTFTLTVSDDTDSNFDTVAVTISDVNRAPAVDAGSDQTVNEGVTVTLAGTASDADGDAMTYKWTHDSGLLISLADDTALLTTFTAPEVAANTTVTFTLTVSDDTDSNFDAVAVTISDVNRAPAVDAGSDQTVNEGVTVTLAGTASDADGDAMTYKWTHDSGLLISIADDTALLTTFTAPEVAANTTVTFTLTVSDGLTNSTDTVLVTVSDVPNDSDFVTTWETATPGESITIPARGTYTIDWGDGTVDADVRNSQTHAYDTAGNHTVRISDGITGFHLDGHSDASKLRSVDQWGDARWKSMYSSFKGASNMILHATDAPDLSRVKDARHMFMNAHAFDGDLSGWDVSRVKDARYMFMNAHAFDGDLSGWDVSRVTDMEGMFWGAHAFDGDLSGWDVSRVTDMYRMFNKAHAFDGDVSAWNVSSVANMNGMFSSALSFNGDLSAWDVSSVTNMYAMFAGASSFDGDLSAWDVSSVTDMADMLRAASSFNGDLYSWDITSVTRMSAMFYEADAFDQNLGSWYIVLDDAVIDGSSVPGEVGRIFTQNSFLDDQNPTYGIGSGGDSAHFKIDDSSILKMKSVPDGHAGPYSVTITSTGTYGSENSRTFDISVTEGTGNAPSVAPSDPPSDPRDVGEITLSSTQPGTIEITWNAPGETPKDYRVAWAKAGENFLPRSDLTGNAFSTSPGHTVTDLEEGEEYKVKVRARYDSGGAGDWSAEFTVAVAETVIPTPVAETVTPTPVIGPREIGEISLTSIQPGTIQVAWDAPSEEPRDYRVAWAKVGENFLTRSNHAGNAFPTSPDHSIMGLDEGEEYQVKVRARYDSGGAGDWSAEFTVTVART